MDSSASAASAYLLNVGYLGGRAFAETLEHFMAGVAQGRGGYPGRGDMTWLHLSPPCQTYSKACRQGRVVKTVGGSLRGLAGWAEAGGWAELE